MPWIQTEARLREALAQPPLHGFDTTQRPLTDIVDLKRIRSQLPAEIRETKAFERALLISAAIGSTSRVAGLPLPSLVKIKLEEHFLALLEPSAAFDLDHPWFPAWVKIVTLQRFPAGQLDFECTGLPRSRLLKAPWRDRPRLAACIATQLGGFAPCLYSHVAVKRKNRFVMTEAESNRSYYQIAQTMKLQPNIRGLFTESWFHSPDTVRVSPHLAWFNQAPSENGAVITTIGRADLDSGVFERSPERRKLFHEGKFHPTTGLLIWPRRELIAWADGNPQWESNSR